MDTTTQTEPGGGTLYLVGTPIGNLEDITLRALRVLERVDVVAAEDTRRTRALLAHHGIAARVLSYREHNREAQGRRLVERLAAGENVALVSDAGMPGVSDPGAHLVRLAGERGLAVEIVPGVSAVTAALALSGFGGARFHFEGFLPRTRGLREDRLAALAGEEAAVVLFESPRRVKALLKDAARVLGARPMMMARELTKLHQQVLRGAPAEILAALGDEPVLGEVVVVVSGAVKGAASPHEETVGAGGPAGGRGPRDQGFADPAEIERQARALLEEPGLGSREAAARLARRYGLTRREAYRLVVRLAEGENKGR